MILHETLLRRLLNLLRLPLHAVAAAVVTGAVLAPCLALAQPKLEVVGGTNLNFGEVYTGKVHRHQVVLRNPGSDTLVISNVSASCGCTVALMTADHIAPGDSGMLSISFSPPPSGGSVEKAVSFDANDSTQRHVRVLFKAKVVKAFDLRPEYVVFRTSADSAATQTLTLKNIGEQPVTILSAVPSTRDLRVTFPRDPIEPGKEGRIVVTFSPSGTGPAQGTLVITTDESHVPTLNVRYFALVSPKGSRTPAPAGSSSRDQK